MVSNPRFAGLRVEFLNKDTLSLSSKHVAVLDRSSNKSIRVWEGDTGWCREAGAKGAGVWVGVSGSSQS